jgi:mono/diheme cytochrome c family protein
LRLHFLIGTVICMVLSGCRQDMQDQPRYKTLGYSTFFEDGRDSRPLPANTVARGTLNEDPAFYQGKVDGKDIEYFPIAITQAVIERGQNRFDIYCSPCHGRLGNGLGMIVRRGMKQPPSYHIDRLRTAPVGHFFDVVTNGYGVMLNYSAQIQPSDRWAIISYIRALQFSQNANVADLPPDVKAKLPEGGKLTPDSKAVPATRPGAE